MSSEANLTPAELYETEERKVLGSKYSPGLSITFIGFACISLGQY